MQKLYDLLINNYLLGGFCGNSCIGKTTGTENFILLTSLVVDSSSPLIPELNTLMEAPISLLVESFVDAVTAISNSIFWEYIHFPVPSIIPKIVSFELLG
jgi:hypothetical protein